MDLLPEYDTSRAAKAWKLFSDAQACDDIEGREYRTDEFHHRIPNPFTRAIQEKYGKAYVVNFLDRVCRLQENGQTITGFAVKAPEGEEWSKAKLARARRRLADITKRCQFQHLLFPAACQDEATYGSSYFTIWGSRDDRRKAAIHEVDAEHGRLVYVEGSLTEPELFAQRYKLTRTAILDAVTEGDSVATDEPETEYTGLQLAYPDGHLERYWARCSEVESPEGWHPLVDTFVPDPETGAPLDLGDGSRVGVWPTNGRGKLLVTHVRNEKGKRGYGTPAHAPAYKSQNEMVSTVNSRQQALDYGGVGSIVILNDPDVMEKLPGYGSTGGASPFYNPFAEGQGNQGQGELFPVEDEWVSGPGAVNRLGNAKQVQQLKADSVDNYLASEERSLLYLCSVTETAFGDMLPEKGQAVDASTRRQGRMGFIRRIRRLLAMKQEYVGQLLAEALAFEDPDLEGVVVVPQFDLPDDFDAIERIEQAMARVKLYQSIRYLPRVAQVAELQLQGHDDTWIETFLEEMETTPLPPGDVNKAGAVEEPKQRGGQELTPAEERDNEAGRKRLEVAS